MESLWKIFGCLGHCALKFALLFVWKKWKCKKSDNEVNKLKIEKWKFVISGKHQAEGSENRKPTMVNRDKWKWMKKKVSQKKVKKKQEKKVKKKGKKVNEKGSIRKRMRKWTKKDKSWKVENNKIYPPESNDSRSGTISSEIESPNERFQEILLLVVFITKASWWIEDEAHVHLKYGDRDGIVDTFLLFFSIAGSIT